MSQRVLDNLSKLKDINAQHLKITDPHDPTKVFGDVDLKGKIRRRTDSHTYEHAGDITAAGVKSKATKGIIGHIGDFGEVFDKHTVSQGKVDDSGNILDPQGHVIAKVHTPLHDTRSAGAAAMLLLLQKKKEHEGH
ncbi:MAG TPA: hypothetical protein VEA59_01620 [Patescibacteria group bacterium]|nr:hypothetical protein [Patescibacteria group bacterium]